MTWDRWKLALPRLTSPSAIAHGSLLSMMGALAYKGANALGFLLVARFRGVEDAGAFSLAITYVVGVSAASSGLDELLTRDIAAGTNDERPSLGSYIRLRFALSIAGYALVLVMARLLGYPRETAQAIRLVGLCIIIDSVVSTLQAALAGRNLFMPSTIANAAGAIVKVGGGLCVLAAGGTWAAVGLTWVAGSILTLSLTYRAVRPYAQVLDPTSKETISSILPLVSRALPFLGIGLLVTIEYQADVIILSATRGQSDVGVYGAATTVAFAFAALPQAFRAALYPRLAAYSHSDRSSFKELYRLSFLVLGLLAFPIAIGLYLTSRDAVVLLFGRSFEVSSSPLGILALCLVFMFLNVPTSRAILASGYARTHLAFVCISLTINIALNIGLTPYYGATASALCRFISSGVFFASNYVFASRRIVGFGAIRMLARPIVATVMMAIVVLFLGTAPILVRIGSGAVVYGIALVALRAVPPGTGERLKAFMLEAEVSAKGEGAS